MASIFRDNLLQGKHAFVTGGSSGINLRIAERFAQHGAKVSLLGRKQEKLDAAVALIKGQGGTALGFSADVRDYEGVERAIKTAVEAHGELDILVCGAAGNFPAPAMGMSANGFKSVIDIDVLGTFNACRAAFEHLKKPGSSVLSVSATQAFIPTPMQAHVSAAKAGVDMLTRVLAIEWGGAGIRVNAIAPGPVDETEGMKRITPTEETKQMLASTIPLQRYATKDEIADLALFVCSDAAAYMTGSVVVCDGGQSLLGSGMLMKALGM
ncbi:MAG: SDR family oxidoreductase [Myxococcales bacterium]